MVGEASPLLAQPLPKAKPPLPRSRSRSLPALNAWAGRLSVFAWAVEFDTHEVFNAALDDRLFPPPYSRAGVRRFDRDVVHLRLQQPDLLDQHEPSAHNGIQNYHSVANSGVDDIICGHGEIFIFSYGCVVFYGVSGNGERAVMSALRHYEAGRLSIRDSRSDSFNYQYMDWKENETPLLRVLEDTVLIANAPEDELVLSVKLAAAHAVAQNAKLGSYENAIDLISARVMHIPGELATTGSLNLSDRDILKLQGELFSLVSHISISTRIQNIPDWFWEREHLEPVFACMHRYLNMEQRLGLLNSRMDRLQEMYDLFRDVQTTAHGHRLEWIVIYLIFFEIVLNIVELLTFFYGATKLG